jgi:hypothetical protein
MMGNVDDVMVGTTDAGKVVTGRTHAVFNVEDKKLPHFTLLKLITASGGLAPPSIVAPALMSAKKFFKRLIDTGRAHSDSSANGWVTGVI